MTTVYNDEQILRAISQDPLTDAERVYGTTYKGDRSVSGLALMLQARKVEAVNHMLKSRGDVTYYMPLEEYIDTVKQNGFEQVYHEEFSNNDGGKDALMVFFREPGQLLVFDTYRGQQVVNGGHVYYNWLPTDPTSLYRCQLTSSGGYHKCEDGTQVWCGDHDCRSALLFNLGRLAEYGTFVSPWVHRPFLWLMHWKDTEVKGYDYKAINNHRITKLPEHVRKCMTPGGPEDA